MQNTEHDTSMPAENCTGCYNTSPNLLSFWYFQFVSSDFWPWLGGGETNSFWMGVSNQASVSRLRSPIKLDISPKPTLHQFSDCLRKISLRWHQHDLTNSRAVSTRDLTLFQIIIVDSHKQKLGGYFFREKKVAEDLKKKLEEFWKTLIITRMTGNDCKNTCGWIFPFKTKTFVIVWSIKR